MPTEREKGIAVISLIVTLPSPFAKINTTTTANKRAATIQPIKEIVIAFERELFVFSRIGKKKKISLISIDK